MLEPEQANRPPRSPKRRSRRRRVLVVVVLLVAGLAAYIWAVDRVLARRLSREMDRLLAVGEPVTWEQIWPDAAIPDERNAAVAYQEAERAVVWPAEAMGQLSMRELLDPAIVRAQRDLVDRVLAANQRVVDLLAEGCRRSVARWKRPVGVRPAGASSPQLTGEREPGYLGCAALLCAAQDGDLDQCIFWTRATLRYGEAIAVEKPGLSSFMQSWTVQNLALRALEGALPDWSFRADIDGSAAAEAHQFMLELLDAQALHEQCRTTYAAERLTILEAIRPLNYAQFGGDVNPGTQAQTATRFLARLSYPIRSPWIRAEELSLVGEFSGFLAACAAPDYGSALAGLPSSIEGRFGVARPLSNLWNRPDAPLWRLHLGAATRRMAAVAVAIKLYEAQHGTRPDRLADLVPQFLPAVPRDPFAAHTELRYLAGEAPARLYSVGRDGQDDGGVFRRGRRGWRDPWVQGDWAFLLEPAPRPALPGPGGGPG